MAKHEFFKKEFDKLATNGFIGHPDGAPAYAYLRVSSDEQGEEGRSGLPRQIEHIHEKAYQERRRIPWDMVYADDYTGFELERPELSRLRQELRQQSRRADAVVIEHLDRLSRNADWHQGFLLDEMKQLGVTPLFWKSFSSRIERAVMGAISQEGMEQAKQRMMEGNLHKACSGRVTARFPAYGYKLVDSQGREGDSAKKDTHYAIREEEAEVVRLIYRKLINGNTLTQIANDLWKAGVQPPKWGRSWTQALLRVIIMNPVYRGDFYAHRMEYRKVQKPTKDGLSTRTVQLKTPRPPEEWIHVAVPPIVSREDWDTANHMLEQNRKMARRNAKEPYLLTGLLKCAVCGATYTGKTQHVKKPNHKPRRIYRCNHKDSALQQKHAEKDCDNRAITCETVDAAVWSVICRMLVEPQLLIDTLEKEMFSEQNAQLEHQIKYLEREIEAKQTEDERLYRAYVAGAFDEQEYAARRQIVKAERVKLTDELSQLQKQLLTREEFEERKTLILSAAKQLHDPNDNLEPPFELKQRILKMLVDKIILNTKERWFQIEGKFSTVYSIEYTSASTG